MANAAAAGRFKTARRKAIHLEGDTEMARGKKHSPVRCSKCGSRNAEPIMRPEGLLCLNCLTKAKAQKAS